MSVDPNLEDYELESRRAEMEQTDWEYQLECEEEIGDRKRQDEIFNDNQ